MAVEFRKATERDLPAIKTIYEEIVNDMKSKGVNIWHDEYPYTVFCEEVPEGRLYVLTEGAEILSAISILDTHPAAKSVTWSEPDAPATYMSRLGVNVAHRREGIARKTLNCALSEAGRRGSKYLRLFAVDINYPAITMYGKYGFTRAGGVYVENLPGGLITHEYGFEKATDEPI